MKIHSPFPVERILLHLPFRYILQFGKLLKCRKILLPVVVGFANQLYGGLLEPGIFVVS